MEKLGYVYAIAAALTWGLTYTLDEKLLDKASPMMLLSINAMLALAVSLPVVLWKEGFGSYTSLTHDRSWFALLMVVQVLTVFANWLIYSAIAKLNAATASIFEIAYPFCVVFFSMLIFKTTLTPAAWLGGLLIFIGSAVIVTQG